MKFNSTHRWLKVLCAGSIAGAAGLQVVGCAAPGEAMDDGHSTPAAVKTAAFTYHPPVTEGVIPAAIRGTAPVRQAAQLGDAGPVPAINLFGEMNNVEGGPRLSRGEAGFQQHTFCDEGYDGDVSVDPTAKWLVFASTRHSVHPNLYLQRVDGQSVTQLTDDACDYAQPTFSPDGKQIAFASTRGGGGWGVYVMDADGKNVVQLTASPAQSVHPSFSPDGRKLAYCALGGRSGQWELWTLDLGTGEKRMIGFGLFPVWSPAKDVNRIAFQRARERGGRWFSLWTLDLTDAGEARRITEVATSSNAALITPSWSPDGKRLAFATVEQPAGGSGDKPAGRTDVWTIGADGSGRRRVTDGVGANLAPAWAGDGRLFFVSDRGGNECVWSAPGDRGAITTASATKTETPAREATTPREESPKGEAIGAIDPR